MHKFCEKKLQIFCKQPVKGNLHNFSFSWLKIRLIKILQKFLHIWNGIVKGFSKMYNFSFFGQIFFCKHFCNITGFCDKKFNFCKFANVFAYSKSRAQELFNDESFVIFRHQTRDLEGGGSNWLPPSISWFSSTPAGIGLIISSRLYSLILCG